MLESEKKQESMLRELKEKEEQMQRTIDIQEEQLKIYQELQKLQKVEVYRFNHLQILQEKNLILRGIGQNLVELGKVLDEKLTGQVGEEEEEELEQTEAEKHGLSIKENPDEDIIDEPEEEEEEIEPEEREIPGKSKFKRRLMRV